MAGPLQQLQKGQSAFEAYTHTQQLNGTAEVRRSANRAVASAMASAQRTAGVG